MERKTFRLFLQNLNKKKGFNYLKRTIEKPLRKIYICVYTDPIDVILTPSLYLIKADNRSMYIS